MRYRGKTPVKSGDMVELYCPDEDGNQMVYATCKVRDALASQFTVMFNKRIHFYFYEDKGITWQHIKTS